MIITQSCFNANVSSDKENEHVHGSSRLRVFASSLYMSFIIKNMQHENVKNSLNTIFTGVYFKRFFSKNSENTALNLVCSSSLTNFTYGIIHQTMKKIQGFYPASQPHFFWARITFNPHLARVKALTIEQQSGKKILNFSKRSGIFLIMRLNQINISQEKCPLFPSVYSTQREIVCLEEKGKGNMEPLPFIPNKQLSVTEEHSSDDMVNMNPEGEAGEKKTVLKDEWRGRTDRWMGFRFNFPPSGHCLDKFSMEETIACGVAAKEPDTQGLTVCLRGEAEQKDAFIRIRVYNCNHFSCRPWSELKKKHF